MFRELIDEVLERDRQPFYLWVAYLRYFMLLAFWLPAEFVSSTGPYIDINFFRVIGLYMLIINTLCVISLKKWRFVLANLTLCGASDVLFGALVFFFVPGFSQFIVVLYVFEIAVTGMNYSPIATVFMASMDLAMLFFIEFLRHKGISPFFAREETPAAITEILPLVRMYFYVLFIATGAYVAYRTTSAFKAKERRIRDYSENLEEMVEERTAELASLNAMKDEFLIICSHDLKSPLTTITGYAELLESSLDDFNPEEMQDILRRVQTEGRRMSEFITELLDLAKFEAGRSELNLTPAYLATLARVGYEEFDFQAREKWFDLSFSPAAEELEALPLDRRRVEQVVCNLLSNALHFTPEGGRVSIRVFVDGDGWQALEVSDSGPGVDVEDLDRIFEKFYQARRSPSGKRRGSGLGLAICKQIVDLHEGKIDVWSEPGSGARFTVRFPTAGPKGGKVKSPAPRAPEPPSPAGDG